MNLNLLHTASLPVRVLPGLLARLDPAWASLCHREAEGTGSTPLLPPLVLHVGSESGGGPGRAALRGLTLAPAAPFRVAAAFLHPRHDQPAEARPEDTAGANGRLHEVLDAGPLDPRPFRELLALCREFRVSVWHAHDARAAFLGLMLRRLRPMKLVATVHEGAAGLGRGGPHTRAEGLCLPRFDHVIAVSPALYGRCLGMGVRAERMSLIPEGIDAAAFRRTRSPRAARHEAGVRVNRFVIGGVGRLSPEKGFDLALRTLAEVRRTLPQAELHLVGDGPERGRLEALTRALGQESAVRFWGWQPRTAPFYEMMDLLLAPGLGEAESPALPAVVLEAMAMGVPVAAAPTHAARALLKGGHSGLILGPDPEAWPDDLVPLLTDASIRVKCSRRGLRRVEKHFTLERQREQQLGLYARLLTPRSGVLRPAA